MRFLLALMYHRREQSERAEFLEIIETNVVERSRQEEVGKMERTIAQALIEEGRELGTELGKEIGKELGIVMAKKEDLIKLLRSKFGIVPQTLMEKIKSIHRVKQLDALFDLVLAVKTIEEVKAGIAEILTEF